MKFVRIKYSVAKKSFCSDLRLKAVRGDSIIKETKVRIATLAIVSLKGRGRDLADLIRNTMEGE